MSAGRPATLRLRCRFLHPYSGEPVNLHVGPTGGLDSVAGRWIVDQLAIAGLR